MTDGSIVLAALRLLVSLAVVLVLLVMLARWASKRGIGSTRPGKATVEVDVLTRRSLGRNSTLQVVKVGSQVMVLGVTERGVSVLGELDDEDLVTAAPPLTVVASIGPSSPSTGPSPLSNLIPTAVRRVLGAPAPEPRAAVPAPVAAVPTPVAATPEAAAFLSALAAAPALAPSDAPFVWPEEELAAPMPPADPSPTYAIAESRALALAGYATAPVSFAESVTDSVGAAGAEPVLQTRAAAREARRAAGSTPRRRSDRHTGSTSRRSRTGRSALPGTQPRRSRTIVPMDSRSTRRADRQAAEVPTGWPWNAAALVLGVGRGRRA